MRYEYRRLERIVRGVSCHRRIHILDLLIAEPNQDLISIARRLGIDTRVANEHTRRLFVAGMITKRAVGRRVLHHATKRGEAFASFLQSLE